MRNTARVPTPPGTIFYILRSDATGMFDSFYRLRYDQRILGRCLIDPRGWTIVHDFGQTCPGEDPRCISHKGTDYLLDNTWGSSSLIVPADNFRPCKLPSKGKNLSLISHGDELLCIEWLRPLTVLSTTESPYPDTWRRVRARKESPDYSLRGGTPGYKTPVDDRVYVGFGHRTTAGPKGEVKHNPFVWRLDVKSWQMSFAEVEAQLERAITDPTCVVQHDGRFYLQTVPRTTLANKDFGFNRHFKDMYTVKEEIGRGSFGRTHIAEAKSQKGGTVAVKIIPKSSMISEAAIMDVHREVQILSLLSGHEGIVEFMAAYEDLMNVYIVMELCQGGELMDDILSNQGPYKEATAVELVWQILTAVAYMHEKNVIHRDIKPENFIFANEKDNIIKAIDFGLSYKCQENETVKEVVGSPFFVAPEVLKQAYNLKADEWSVGVLTYILLIGTRPFFGRTDSEIFKAVLRDEPDIDNADLSLPAKDFLKRLLNRNVESRATAREALDHPWLRDRSAMPVQPGCGSSDTRSGLDSTRHICNDRTESLQA
ncbi:Serine/Threonine protein kinases [Klebsormidium nitens]|uniref:Serine/Threonine protein kinases n=1 Tax=Klebsormidium nitens TaxID=105231 RepID=A0A1Y1IL39_KLENI|nr:Serine/Threonine protein kinases [Klebsormidium nitens]|eukprot:GAQ89841.1 Serine/Threonine protein kinases [Klebsormidium nitens]